MTELNRENAWLLLTEHTKSDSLRRHALAVEAAMRRYAEMFGEDIERWGITGLLHDFDYEKYPSPEDHPFRGVEILRDKQYPEEIIEAILGHATYSGVPRTSRMAKTLFAVDELCGFIVAVAYVRPDNLNGMTPKSVKKKLKDKQFAAKVSREDIETGTSELGVDRDEHIVNIIGALSNISANLGFGEK